MRVEQDISDIISSVMSKLQPVITRMAPSPTGELHVGSLSIALKNYAWAKRNNGKFILRIEDTDQKREVEGAIDRLKDILQLFNLRWDEGPYIQSKRLDLYQQKAKQLVESDHAYYCFCSPERLQQVREQMMAEKKPPQYDKRCRALTKKAAEERVQSGEAHVIRLKVPADKELTFTDLIRGKISFNSNSVDDQVLIKSDGFPTYHLAVVVDDYDMNVTHICRGEEWISSTPKHILLYQAFGWKQPVFCHFPVFLNPDGKGKMSKRKGSVSVESFLARGYLPEALLNFLMILGWAPKDENEVMDLERYIREFDPSEVSAKSVIFDLKKLDWLNGVYIRNLADEELLLRLNNFLPPDFPADKASEILPLIKERLVTLADIEALTDFFYREVEFDSALLLKKSSSGEVIEQLKATQETLKNLKSWEVEEVEASIRKLQEQNDWHKGQFFMMLRLAVTAKKATPPLFDTLKVLGKETVIRRLQQAQQNL